MAEIIDTEEIIIGSELDVLTARILGKKTAAALGFAEIALAEIEIVISELGTNIVKHAESKGSLVFRILKDNGVRGIEITAQDQGPGIEHPEFAIESGYSSTGTLGIGLSGVRRLTDEFDLQSKKGRGTTVRARKWMKEDYRLQVRYSVISKPKLGESVCGDAYFFKHLPSFSIFSVIDALGHGFHAHEIADRTLRILESNYHQPLSFIVENCHEQLKKSRGAAAAFGRIDFNSMKFQHICIGNVETRVYITPALLRPVCSNGILGTVIERIHINEYPYTRGACIVMFSDGISGKFELDASLLRKGPQDIGHFIFRNYAKNHDDATVLVLK